MLLGYMKTLTLAPCFTIKHFSHIIPITNPCIKMTTKSQPIENNTMDFGGRLDLNLARTTPLLPCGRATFPHMQR